jgi:hypothetical protein
MLPKNGKDSWSTTTQMCGICWIVIGVCGSDPFNDNLSQVTSELERFTVCVDQERVDFQSTRLDSVA